MTLIAAATVCCSLAVVSRLAHAEMQATSAPFNSPYPIPAAEQAVCKALSDADEQFSPLDKQWHEANASDSSNEVRKRALVAEAKRQIDELYAKRNVTVLKSVAQQHPRISVWVVRIGKIELNEKDFGSGTKSYIVMTGDLPCATATTFGSKDIEGKPPILAAFAKLNAGDYVVISGDFIAHDEEMQGPAAAIEWGGILWGPFGGLWTNAIRKPAFQINISDIHRG